MVAQAKHLAREIITITKMTEIYCSAHHGSSGPGLCAECDDYVLYSTVRLEKCPYGEEKPTCANCPVHCAKRIRKEQGMAIMRYAGPRMLLRHPLLLIAHKWDSMRKVKHPRELTREERMRLRGK
jgi:hypothetical protein